MQHDCKYGPRVLSSQVELTSHSLVRTGSPQIKQEWAPGSKIYDVNHPISHERALGKGW